MTDADLFPFLDVFKTLTKVFPFRGDDAETNDIGRAYFKTLRKFPFDQVKLGADNCMASMEKFPKPADWMKRIPRRMPGPEYGSLTASEESEWRDAERRGFEGYIELGANTLKTRFVPHDPDEPAMMGERKVLRGFWLHGEGLQHWYAARENFYNTFTRALPSKTWPGTKKLSAQERIEQVFMRKTHAAIYATREPGEEG